MTDPIKVAEIAKNRREAVAVTLEVYHGYRLLQMRVWANDPEKGPLPTRSGLALRIERLADLQAALAEAERQAITLGWLPPIDSEGGA